MKLFYILAIIFAISLVFAAAEPCTSTVTEFKSEFNDDEYWEDDYLGGEDLLEELSFITTQEQYFASLEQDDYELNMQMADDVKQMESFTVRRKSSILLQYGMTPDEYDILHSDALAQIDDVTELLGLEYNPYTTTFSQIMLAIDKQIPHASSEVATEALTILMSVRQYSDLFINRYTLLSAIDEDAMLGAIINLNKAINWLINHFRGNKCKYCKKIAGYVRKKACGAAGGAVCGLISKVAGPFAALVKKYGCGSPLNFSSKLGSLCSKAVVYFTRNTRASDTQICKAIAIPKLSWKSRSNRIYKITGRTVNFGRAC